ncbi:unnamed protein product [Paramecium primaurelia]|uniref:Vacuolar protein sorting-associated protein 13 VPS13 adaptor binding domain-containing protein n=1 Tax=Paramecium primaurelia TaxID=5886 RepID=A0A8S1M3Q6_PARPR|nr:unnamed protein product [Paramecium primaurelia]
MQQLVRKYILKKLKSFVPDLNEHQISLALSQGYLQLDNMDIAPLQIENFIITATVSCFIMKLQWSSLHLKVEIQNVKVMIQKAQGLKKQEKSSESKKSKMSIPISIALDINDVEINFMNMLMIKIMHLKCEIKNRQNLINGELNELNLKLNYNEQSFAQIGIQQVRWDVNIEQETVQTYLECIYLKDMTNQRMQKLVKLLKIGLNISKNVYNKPLVKISIEKGVCHWNAKVIHTLIYSGIDFALQFITMPQKQQIRQTDMENPDSLAISIEVNSIKLHCQNNYIPLGLLQGSNVTVFIKVSKYIGDVIIEGKDLCYYEQSNYPHQMIVKKGFQMIKSEQLIILIKIYDDYCPLQMINNDLYNFVEIKLKKGQIYYMQQPFLRFMDWLIEQFISLIIKDYGVTSIPIDIIEQKLRDHRFTSIKLSIEDICAYCKPIITSDDGLKLVCSSFALHTEIRECNDRSNMTIWETLLCMEIKDILISVIINKGESIISQMMNCELIVSKCGFSQLYILKQIPLDRTFKINMYLSAPKLYVSKKTYLLIMRLLFNNILYDDTLDQLYLYQINKPTPILLELRMDQINLKCEDDLSLIGSQLLIRFHRQVDQSQIFLNLLDFVAYHKQHLILSKLNIDDQHFVEYKQTNKQTGQKDIQILIPGVNGTLNLNWLFTSINFFLIDDTVQLILPFDNNVLKPLNLELIIQQVDVLLQPLHQDTTFQAKGNLLLVFIKNQSQDIHYAYHQEPLFDDNTPSSCMKIESSQLTLYVNENGKEPKEVFQPISVQWKSQNFQCYCTQTHQFLNESNLNLENLKLYLTIEQGLKLIDLIKYLIQSMWDANQFGDQWNERYSLISQSRKSFNIDHLELWLMSSKKNTIVPILTTFISLTPLFLHQSYQKMLLSGNIKIEASYFNPMIGILEPILEKFSFDLMFLRNKLNTPNIHLQIETNKSSKFSQLNIVFHQNLIILLNDLYNVNKKKKDRKKSTRKSINIQEIMESPQNETIILFNIQNQSGYDLSITIDEKTLTIKNGNKTDFNATLSQIDIWRKYNRLNVEFYTLNKKLIKLNKVEQNSQQPFKIDRQQCYLYFTSYISKLTRIIKIQGQLTITNCTLFEQQIDIIHHNNVIWNKLLQVNERVAPPGELISDQYFIRFTLYKRIQEFSVSLKALLHSEFTYLEIPQGDQFVILSSEDEFQNTRHFKLSACLVVHNSLPCPLNITINEEQQSIAVNDSLQFYYYTSKNQIDYSVEILEFQSKEIFKYQPLESNQQTEIQLINEEGSIIKIMQKITLIKGSLFFYFYPKICLINTTSINLNYHTLVKNQKLDIALFNNNYTFLFNEANLILSYNNYYSNEFTIKAIGDTSVEIKVRKQQQFELLEFGINISLLETVKQLGLYSTIIEIAPRYVIINQTENVMQVQQQNSYGSPFNIDPNSRLAFNWTDCTKEKMIAIKFKNTKWSEGLYLSDMRTIHFSMLLRQEDKSKIFMQCVIVKKKATFFVTFLIEQAPYKIINQCSNYSIRFAQIGSEQEENIGYNQFIEFSWTFPSLKPILIFNVTNEQDHCEFQFDLFKSDSTFCQKISVTKSIYFSIYFENSVKVIKIMENQEQQFISDQINKLIYINLQMITISIIMNEIKPKELNLITLSNFEVGIQEINRIISYQFKLKFINIDNNYSYDALNQVLLTPQQFQSYLEQQNYAIDIKWAVNQQHANILMIEYFFAYIAPLELKLDQEYLYQLMALKKALTFEKQDINIQHFTTSKYLFNQNKSYQTNQNPFYEWMIVEIPPPSGNVYIKQLILPVLKIRFSFQTLYQQNQNFILNVIANSLDFAVKNIDNAPITLKGVKMENIFDTQQGLQTIIKEHYKFALLKQFLQILGSIEILGNPTSFLNRISTGVVDLIEKPIEAMSLGPLEMGLGVLEGASSLIKNTVAGAFYSVNKITGSIGNQISLLSFDEDYISSRRKFMQRKPSQLFEGIYLGIHALITGIGDGVVGFFSHPYQHGKRDGAVGILKGSTIGIAGVIIKPLTSVFDAASKTAEGLTNTATYFDDHPNTLRMRDIRAFYENSRYIKAYNEDDSFFLNYLSSYSIVLIDVFGLYDLEMKKDMHLVMTQTLLFYMNKQSGIKWQQQVNSIRDYKLYQDENNPSILRLYLFFEKEQILKLKFSKVPYQDQINQKLQNMIEQS